MFITAKINQVIIVAGAWAAVFGKNISDYSRELEFSANGLK